MIKSTVYSVFLTDQTDYEVARTAALRMYHRIGDLEPEHGWGANLTFEDDPLVIKQFELPEENVGVGFRLNGEPSPEHDLIVSQITKGYTVSVIAKPLDL